MQVPKTLPPRSAEALAKKEESGSFLTQAEQYLESILDVKTKESWVYRRIRVQEVEIRDLEIRPWDHVTVLFLVT
jgi:hypothetical protein